MERASCSAAAHGVPPGRMKWRSGGSFARRIARGRVLGYRDVAALAGNALAARQAGAAMKKAPAGVPWWRVVGSDGRLRTGAEGARRLRAEGVVVENGRVRIERFRGLAPASRTRTAESLP